MRILPAVLALVLAGCATPAPRPDSAPSKPGPGWVPSDVDAAEMCRQVQCQHDLHVVLKRENGSTFDKTFDAMPVVQENSVTVYAGQTVYFEADVQDGKLANLRLVPAIVDPARTVSSSLEQTEDGGMMLVTRNPFGKPLRIRMGMMPLDVDRLVRTSSCPVMAGGGSYEMWPHPIFQIFLSDMRLLEEGDAMACVE